jgi:hypothetical protein
MGTLEHLQQLKKTSTQKLVIGRDKKTRFGVLKVFSLAERKNPIPNEKNSGLGDERSLLYLRGGSL